MSPCRVLIADDTPDIRMMLRWSLEPDERFEVVGEAENGAEAVRIATEQHPDVVILDLAMPVMDGLQAIPEIKKNSPKTKIIILSAFESGSMSEEAISRGADAYMEKGRPFDEITELLVELCAA
jgi:YesN/AraC family two-component response regulator